ncbi:MAG: hypothetical protein M1839_000822 [Geoglossum umbratile]|nr:MAG: hypothetical protein M1839_000822 [Geoglossum umbratile]
MAGRKRSFHDREDSLPSPTSNITSNDTPNLQGYDIPNPPNSEAHNGPPSAPIGSVPYPNSSYPFHHEHKDFSRLDGSIDSGLGLSNELGNTTKIREDRSVSGRSYNRNPGTLEVDRWGSTSSSGRSGNHIRIKDEPETASAKGVRDQAVVGLPADGGNMSGDGGAEGGSGEKTQVDEGEGSQPPWSELKTKAGKERKRLPLACIACRRKKIRCSGQKPSCRHCLRSRIPCVYKATARKAAHKTDYMAVLDKRLKKMEDRIVKVIPEEEVNDALSTERGSVKPVPPGGSVGKVAGGKKATEDEAFTREIESWADQSHPKDRGPYWPLKRTDLEENSLFYDGAEHLPSQEIQEHLAEIYFDYVYGQAYLLLHKPSFMRRLRAGKVPPVLMLAVCAVSARFSTHPQVVHDPPFLAGGLFAQPARDIVLKRYNETNLTLLIVLVLLCLHEFGTCQGGSSWMLGGMAIRMGYTLQLHREVFLDPVKNKQFDGLSTTDKEIRRRTIWACFMVDGFTSSGSERPMFVNEEDIEVQLPIKERHFLMNIPGPTESLDGRPLKLASAPQSNDGAPVMDPKCNMGSGAYMVRIVALWRRVTRYLNLGGKDRDPRPIWSPESRFQALRDQLAAFKATLPKSLLYTRENLNAHAADRIANQFFFVHIAYHQTVLFLHRYAIPTTPGARTARAMPMQFVKDSALITLSAAKAISTIINDSGDYFVVAPFIGYSVFTSSTVHIIGTFSKNAALESSSKRYLAYNLKYLTKMERHWGTFHFMVENLKELYQKHADFARNGGLQATEGSPNESSEILNYGDWFTVTPRGVSVTDLEDPAEELAIRNESVVGQKLDLLSVEEFFGGPPSAATEEQQQHLHRRSSKQPSGNGWPHSANRTSYPTMRATRGSMQGYPPLIPQLQPQQLRTDIPVCGVSIPSAPKVTSPVSALETTYLSGPTTSLYQHALQHIPSPSFPPPPMYDIHRDVIAGTWGVEGSSLTTDFMSETRSHWHIPYNMTPPGAEGGDVGLGLGAGTGFVDFIGGGGGYGPLEDMEAAQADTAGVETGPEMGREGM